MLRALFIVVTFVMTSWALASEHVPRFKKVVVVVFENERFEKALRQPFFLRLAKEGALLTNYHAITHPSEPNYIALIAGSPLGVTDDESHDLVGRHLGDLLEEKGKTWKNYAENFPGDCFAGATRGRYVRKHTPFLSFKNVTESKRCSNVVSDEQFIKDFESDQLPDFSLFTPNMDDDGHDTDVEYGEKWFKRYFGPLLAKKEFKDILLVITFDENDCNTVGPHVTPEKVSACKGDSNQIYTVFYGREVSPGTVSKTSYDHYSLLKTLEAGFDLGSLKQNDKKAHAITGIWRNASSVVAK